MTDEFTGVSSSPSNEVGSVAEDLQGYWPVVHAVLVDDLHGAVDLNARCITELGSDAVLGSWHKDGAESAACKSILRETNRTEVPSASAHIDNLVATLGP